jgi:hypothetical protein
MSAFRGTADINRPPARSTSLRLDQLSETRGNAINAAAHLNGDGVTHDAAQLQEVQVGGTPGVDE